MRSPILVRGMSRSGTTLVTTILDSHPDVAMAYEFVAQDIPQPDHLVAALQHAVNRAGSDPAACARLLNDASEPAVARLVKRAARAGAAPESLLDAARGLLPQEQASLPYSVALAMALTEEKRRRQGARVHGFKLPGSDMTTWMARLPDAAFVCVVRDPADVYASQRERGMAGPLAEFARNWRGYTNRFLAAARRAPERVTLVRYEQLVTSPEHTVRRMLDFLGLPFAEEALRFTESKATVHAPGQRHVNAEALRRGFFDDSVGRGRRDLTRADARALRLRCRRPLRRLDAQTG